MDRVLEGEDGDYFIWDEDKNEANIEKHGVSFEEAITIFRSTDYEVAPDRTSTSEANFIAWGVSANGKELFVVHCHRKIYKDANHDSDEESEEGSEEEIEATRIISARKVKPEEKQAKAEIDRRRNRRRPVKR